VRKKINVIFQVFHWSYRTDFTFFKTKEALSARGCWEANQAYGRIGGTLLSIPAIQERVDYKEAFQHYCMGTQSPTKPALQMSE